MRSSYAMMTTNVTPPLKEEGAKVDGVEKARGDAVLVRSLRLKMGLTPSYE